MISRIFMPKGGDTTHKTYLWTIVAGTTYAGSSFIMSMVASKMVGAYAAGIFAIAMSIGNQLVTVGYYNIRAYQVSDVLEKYTFSDYCAARILTIAAMLAAGGIWIAAGGYSGVKVTAISLMILFKAGEALSDLFEGRYQQKERYDVACRGVFFKTMVFLLGFIITMAVTRNLLLSMGVLAGAYLLTLFIVDGSLVKHFGGFRPVFHWRKQLGLLLACMPLFVNSFLTTYVLNASKYAIDAYYSEEFLGMFNILYMMAFVINLFASFGLKPMISTLSVRYAKGDRKGFIAIIRQQFLVIVGITLVCIGGAYCLGVPVLSWLSGIDLSAYRLALCIMLLGGGFNALFQLLQYGIVIMRHQYSTLAGCALTALFTALVTPMLTKQYAVNGAAAGYLCSMAMMALIFLIFFIYYLEKERRESS